jgi:DNA-binding NtrC family response regulator
MLRAELESREHQVLVAADGKRGIDQAAKELPDVVLLDYRLPDMDGEEVLARILEQEEAPEVVILTAHGSVDIAVKAMKRGAFDFLEKPCRLAELEVVVDKAAHTRTLRHENRCLRRILGGTGGEIYLDPGAQAEDFRRLLDKIAASDLPVLITGETGVGKEVVARMIHRNSARAAAPFLVADCAALQSTLIESELFGHERGAFTGAHAARPGLVEAARGGTLFLDEIGELEASLQSKLLRLLESGEYRRVGGCRNLQADARFIAATNRDLPAEIAAGRFREDLYYRLNVLAVRVLSLRERREEIVPLAEHFLRNSKGKGLRFADETLEYIAKYDWQGNVRELRNVVERMAVLADGEVLEPEDLPPEIKMRPAHGGGSSPSLAGAERRHILRVLDDAGGNKKKAAELLGISPTTLYSKLKAYGEG